MDETYYQVCITGRVFPPVSRRDAIASYASLFSIPHDEAEHRFDIAPCRARGGLTLEQAEKYRRVLLRHAIECLLLPDCLPPRDDTT